MNFICLFPKLIVGKDDDMKKNNSFIQALGYCLHISWASSKVLTVVRIISNMLTPMVAILLAFVTKATLNVLVSGQNSKRILCNLIICYTLINVFSKIIDKVKTYTMGIHNDLILNYTKIEIGKKAIAADMAFFDQAQFYDAFANAETDSISIVNAIWSFFDAVSSMITVLSAFLIITNFNIGFAIILLLLIIPIAYNEQNYMKKIYVWQREHVGDERKMNYLFEVLINRDFAADIRIYNSGKFFLNRHQFIWKNWFRCRRKMIKKRTIVSAILSLLPEIAMGIMIFCVGVLVIKGEKTLGDYSLFMDMLLQLNAGLFELVVHITDINENRIQINNYREFLSFKNLIQDVNGETIGDEIEIEFKNVTFIYPETEKKVLDHVSFKIKKNERVALVGINGSGKSTIIKLLLRFYDATEGEILINGRNIKNYSLESLRKNYSVMFQQYVVYALTVEENVAISEIEHSNREKVYEALEKSGARDMIESLPHGVDTFLFREFDENGVELSGGQKQKIPLARAFYRDSPAVILDEPSASLDPEAEYRIFRSLEKLCVDKTVILTSHRLANIVMVDKIILIENGNILEEGTHKQLMSRGGRYAQLFNYQAGKYKEESKDAYSSN